ncbi:MAG TPA: hypothetical protein VLC91_06080 [Spongiibacteraceae bacterium]|nr:hypothetical protein [Spongiibacteraceae bacterium]
MLKRLLIVALLVWGAHSWWKSRSVTYGAGVVAAHAPEQTALDEARPFDLNGYRITPLAKFVVDARVLSREDYRLGREADLSTTDFMLGWGRMSDENVLSHIEISQSNRFAFWRVQEFPIPQREIETSAANMHLIAADRTVANQLDRIRRGQVVHMRGYLVRADASDGWYWTSSLSREDIGAGACEVFLVEQISD